MGNATTGAHNDWGHRLCSGATDACPILFSSDGGIYRNLTGARPGCHTPKWEQPNVTPHALWNFGFSGFAAAPGAAPEHLYFGNQDTGTFGAVNGGATPVTWTNQRCCDGFDVTGDATRSLQRCAAVSRLPGDPPVRGFAARCQRAGADRRDCRKSVRIPPGNMEQFEHLEAIVDFGTG